MKNAKWENVYVFISSTFNDMHAERDYLVKRVFPELRMWCAKRRLKLIDIDLRWGVSEEDASKNKRVIDVCMQNIDRCRPFFLGFLGQRRGWVPGKEDINKDTLTLFPKLEQYLGKYSITELEIIHALMNPLDAHSSKVSHAFFYFRNPNYMLTMLNPNIRKLFMPIKHDAPFEDFKALVKKNYRVFDYSCKWNRKKTSSELVNVNGKDLSQGRLDDFKVGKETLKESIINNLKQAIMEEFPERESMEMYTSALDIELFHQDTFLFQACDSYIPRLDEEKKIIEYVHGNEMLPFVLKANAGSGKTSMLAHLIDEDKLKGKVFYRFCGTSINSSNTERTLLLLAQELVRENIISEEDYNGAKNNILLSFSSLLSAVKEDITIVLDALDQWDKALEDIYWMPTILNEHVKLVLSLRKDGDAQLVEYFTRHKCIVKELNNMETREEKVSFIKQYMSQFLKDISDDQIEMILHLEGSGNPLYLKIVLNELRIHGSFDTLVEQLKAEYGKTPMDAFEKVLERLENEEYSSIFDEDALTFVFLGCIAYSLNGMNVSEYVKIFHDLEIKASDEEIMDAVYELARHLSPYLMIDGDHIDFLYDSFRKAVQTRYKEAENVIHQVLFQTYALQYSDDFNLYAKNEKTKTLLLNILHHSLHYDKETFHAVVSDIATLYPAVLNLGAKVVASYLMQAYQKYKNSDYHELGEALLGASRIIDTNPNTLLYEIKQRCIFPLAKEIVEQAKEKVHFQYLHPLNENKKRLKPVREISFLPIGGVCAIELLKEYIVYVSNISLWRGEKALPSTIYLQNIVSEKIESTLQLAGPIRKMLVENEYIYIVYTPKTEKDDLWFEIYEIPTLRKVMSKIVPCDLGNGYFLESTIHAYNGQMYALAKREEAPLGVRLYRISDMSVAVEIVYPEENAEYINGKLSYTLIHYSFYGPFMMEDNGQRNIQRLWFIPSGECVYTPLEYHYQGYSGVLNCTQPIFYCYEKRRNNIAITIFIYEEEEILEFETYTIENIDSISIPNMEAFGPFFLIEEGEDVVRVYEGEMELRGYFNGTFAISDAKYPYKLYDYEDNVLVQKNSTLSFYKLIDVMFETQENRPAQANKKEDVDVEPIFYEDSMYVFGKTCKRINIHTHAVEEEAFTGSHGVYETSISKGNTPGNIYKIDGINYRLVYKKIGSYPNKYKISLFDLEDFFVSEKIIIETGNKKVSAVFVSEDSFGVILYDGFDENGTMVPEVRFYSMMGGYMLSKWNMDIHCMDTAIVTLHNQKSYILCTKCKLEDGTFELRIYDPIMETIVYSYAYDKNIRINDSKIIVRDDRLILLMYNMVTREYYFFEYTFNTNIDRIVKYYQGEENSNLVTIKNIEDDKIYAYVHYEEKILIYSIDTLSLEIEIDISKHPGCKQVVCKYGGYFNFKKNGLVDIYLKNGDYLMSQLLPYEGISAYNVPGSNTILIKHGKSQFTFYVFTTTKYL